MDEENYFTFVLGYDLLPNILDSCYLYTSDDMYEICNNIAKEFIKSDYYKDLKHSGYEMLEKYVNDNLQYLFEKYWGE